MVITLQAITQVFTQESSRLYLRAILLLLENMMLTHGIALLTIAQNIFLKELDNKVNLLRR